MKNAVVRYFGAVENFAPEERLLSTRQPSDQFVKDENVAGLIAFLCGQHAEDINGSALPIDGA